MDKEYWEEFYRKASNINDLVRCSTFAEFCQDNFFSETKSIVDLGCGTGRDALYFAYRGHDVLAIDQSLDANLVRQNPHYNLEYLATDFIRPKYYKEEGDVTEYHPTSRRLNVFYSRFTLHSITKEEQEDLLSVVSRCLEPNGLFCIEARTVNDPKFGVGEHISDTTYFSDGHARRFIDSGEFLNTVLSMGFKLRYFNECNNLSVHKDDNPVLMRVILERQDQEV